MPPSQSIGQMEVSDAAAVAQARTGDCDAFRLLVERHSRRLFKLAYRLIGNEADAEDIVQETFLRAYRNLEQFDERAAFATWVSRIATNYGLDLLRVRKNRVQHNPIGDGDEPSDLNWVPSSDPAPDRVAYGSQITQRISEAMKSLTPQERVAFTLRHFEGHTIGEISAVIKAGESATKHAIFRAVQKMRQALQHVEGETEWRS